MTQTWNLISILTTLCLTNTAFGGEIFLSDNQIKDIMIKHNLNHYQGECPCPESLDKAGKKCGTKSVYMKPGVAPPLCYRAQITDQQVLEFRKINDLRASN